MYTKEQLMHMNKKILFRIAAYFNIKGISRWKKENIVDEILLVLPKPKSEDENIQRSVRIMRIHESEE